MLFCPLVHMPIAGKMSMHEPITFKTFLRISAASWPPHTRKAVSLSCVENKVFNKTSVSLAKCQLTL